jgi:hypothetical protein
MRRLVPKKSARARRPGRRSERGDTLIEVILSVSLLSLATVLTMAVVNQSHRNLLAAIQRESVRSEINSQVEMLHYVHDVAVNKPGYDVGADATNMTSMWGAILHKYVVNSPYHPACSSGTTCSSDIVTDVTGTGSTFATSNDEKYGKYPFYFGQLAPEGADPEVIAQDLTKTPFSIIGYGDTAKVYTFDNTGATTCPWEAAPGAVSDPCPKANLSYSKNDQKWSASPGHGIWIDAEYIDPGTGKGKPYINFYVKANWSGAAEGLNDETTSTLVRINLYD